MNRTKQIVLAAMCIAIGVVLPQAFHAIPNAGSIILPMHIPVLLSGFICGPLFGAICGVITPLLSHLIFMMPPTPILLGMMCELAAYGLLTGLLSHVIKNTNKLAKIYCVLILSMLIGRVTYGILNSLIFRVGSYSLQMWLAAAFTTALPGILIQLVLIPAVLLALDKAKVVTL